MKNEIAVGSQTLADGAQNSARGGRTGETIMSQLHGGYYETTSRGNRFGIANQAAVSTTAAFVATFTGLVLGNPTGSGVNLVLDRFSVAQFAVGAAGMVGIMGGAMGAVPITASLTPTNRMLNGKASVALANAGQTLNAAPAPTLLVPAGAVGSLATTGYGLTGGIVLDLEGGIVVPPGYYVASYTTVATTTALAFGFHWEEVAI